MIQALHSSLLPLLARTFQDTAPATEPAKQAPSGDAPRGGGLGDFLIPMILIVGIFYLVLIMPERKKQKQRQAMLDAMKKGDKVMTSSGIYGSVAQIQDDVVVLQVADGVRLRFNRVAIQSVLDDGKGEGDSKKG